MSTIPQPLDRGWLNYLAPRLLPILATLALYEIRIHPERIGFGDSFNEIIKARAFPERPDIKIRDQYTGIPGLDAGLQFFVTAFTPGAAPFKPEYFATQAYFFMEFFSVIAVMSVEACRGGAESSWVWYTSIFGVLYQTVGGAIIVPIWFFLLLEHMSQPDYYSPSSIRLPTSYAKALLPSHILGYLIPTVGMYFPIDDPDMSIRQLCLAIWQLVPVYVNVLLYLFSWLFETSWSKSTSPTDDVRAIKTLFGTCFIVTSASHFALVYLSTQSTWSLSDAFIPNYARVFSGSATEILVYIFQVDFWIIMSAALITAFVAVGELGVSGKARVSRGVLVVGGMGGSFLVGPGAVLAAVWWWREDRIRVRIGDGERERKKGQ